MWVAIQLTLLLLVLLNVVGAKSNIEKRVESLGYRIPTPLSPKGNYASFVKSGRKIYLSGHLPQPAEGPLVKGRLGESVTIEQGQVAARLAALQLIATLNSACDLDKIKKIVKITGFVNSASDFTSQPAVINGCSDFLCEVFGTSCGQHARSAVGVNTLPLGTDVVT